MFSWRLVLAPPGSLETVVVHELAHLRVFGHGPGFWALVAAATTDPPRRPRLAAAELARAARGAGRRAGSARRRRGGAVSQFGLAQVFVLAAIVLIVVHRWVSNRWLAEHHARYRRLPGTDWWREQDPDPTVERWRRLRSSCSSRRSPRSRRP